jgi:hypothetical protein
MGSNVVQLPCREPGEPLEAYRERVASFREGKWWLTKPYRLLTPAQRAWALDPDTWPERPAPLGTITLPLFSFADRKVS